jgi:hypothetical protein
MGSDKLATGSVSWENNRAATSCSSRFWRRGVLALPDPSRSIQEIPFNMEEQEVRLKK